MLKKSQHRASLFFLIAFLAIITAPTLIISFDSSADITEYYSLGEEEESENLKIIFDNTLSIVETIGIGKTNIHKIGYTFKSYPKPDLNLVSPPPEYIL